MGLTASFLPKPVVGVNGSGMHTNVSVSRNGKTVLGSRARRSSASFGYEFLIAF